MTRSRTDLEGRTSYRVVAKPISATESALGVLCRTPGKRAFKTKALAIADIGVVTRSGRSVPYICNCGMWHIQTKKGRR